MSLGTNSAAVWAVQHASGKKCQLKQSSPFYLSYRGVSSKYGKFAESANTARASRSDVARTASRMLMLLCATTAVARMRPGVSVGRSLSGSRPGTRHGSVRCSSDATASAQVDNDARLMTWFAQNGGSGSVAVATQAGLRGLVATRDVQVGDVLLDVPLSTTLLDYAEQGALRTLTRTQTLTPALTLTQSRSRIRSRRLTRLAAARGGAGVERQPALEGALTLTLTPTLPPH